MTTSAPLLPAPAPDDAPLPAGAVADLRVACGGALVLPHGPGFEQLRTGHHPAHRSPASAVVVAADEEQVRCVVEIAARHGLAVRPRATGHGSRPASPPAGAPVLLLDTSGLDGVEVDPAARTATAGAGVRWSGLATATALHGLAPVAGADAAVGVVGSLLGGGLGPRARAHGFGSDHLRTLRLVTPAGRVRRVDADSSPDLYWALRGGGRGLGVVTSVTVDLLEDHLLTETVVTTPAAETVLHVWAAWSATAGEGVDSRVVLLPGPTATVVVLSPADRDPGGAVAALLAAVRGLPGERTARTVSATGLLLGPTGPPPAPPARGSLLTGLPSAAVDAVLAALAGGGPAGLEVRLLGAAAGRAPRTPDAVHGRSATHLATALDPAGRGDPAVQRVDDAWAPWRAGRPLNFLGDAEPHEAWPATTGDRLARLRAFHDPAGVLR